MCTWIVLPGGVYVVCEDGRFRLRGRCIVSERARNIIGMEADLVWFHSIQHVFMCAAINLVYDIAAYRGCAYMYVSHGFQLQAAICLSNGLTVQRLRR